MQLGNLALGHGDQRDAEERHLFIEGGDMFLIAADAVDAFGDDNIDPGPARVILQILVAGPQGRSAGHGGIGIDPCDGPAFLGDQATADPDLVFQRGLALVLRAVAGIDRGAWCG